MQGDLNEKSFHLCLLAFFQKCKQGYFPWYNIGVNNDGAKAKELVGKYLEKIIKSIKGKAFPKLADLSVRKERPYQRYCVRI